MDHDKGIKNNLPPGAFDQPDEYRYLVEEFRRQPIGPHSPQLEALLRRLRTEWGPGKLALLCVKPFREWVMVRLPGRRDRPVEIFHDQIFHSLEEAEWAIFTQRWKKCTGEDLA